MISIAVLIGSESFSVLQKRMFQGMKGPWNVCSLDLLFRMWTFRFWERKILIQYIHVYGTGIRGLMRGMANLPRGNQELFMATNKVGRPPCEFGVSKSMECDIFPSVL